MAGIDESLPFKPVRIAVLSVSDSRTMADDVSGALLASLLTEAGHELAGRAIVKDDAALIRAQVAAWIADPRVDVVITTGGTGVTGRDVTPEAVRPLLDKEMEGFATLMHLISYEKVGTSTMQSRSLGGLAGGVYVFCVPGSPGACQDAWNGILRLQLDSRHKPCNLVELMPRLKEGASPAQ